MRQKFLKILSRIFETLGEQGKKSYTRPDDLADMMPKLGFVFLNWTKINQRTGSEINGVKNEPLNEAST